MEKKFVNGFESWSEAFFLLTDHLSTALIDDESPQNAKLVYLREQVGFIGLCPEVEGWADEFEKLHEGREWDGEFYDEIDEFFKKKVSELDEPLRIQRRGV